MTDLARNGLARRDLRDRAATPAARSSRSTGAPISPSTRKSDDSPLTEADQVAHGIISRRLPSSTRGIPVLSEESLPADHATRRAWTRYWLVDPLDGTKEFFKRNGEFTVNIALVEAQRAVLGAVYAPVLERMYSGVVGLGAWRSDARRPAAADRRARARRRAAARRRQPQPSDTRARGLSEAFRRTRSPTWAAR